MEKIYKILDRAWVYHIVQSIFAPGYMSRTIQRLEKMLQQAPPARHLLDVGCGPSSILAGMGLNPVGVDRSWPYAREYTNKGGRAIVASAEALPFAPRSFDGVWSFGLLHHLPDFLASGAITELLRVCEAGGYVAISDAVLPRSSWRRPLAALIRRLDKGKFMRSQKKVEALLPLRDQWALKRYTYSSTGLESLLCLFLKK